MPKAKMLVDRLPVHMTLVGVNGNAWVLLGVFSRYAREQGWPDEDVKAVCDEAMRGDYSHLLRTLDAHTTGKRNADQKRRR